MVKKSFKNIGERAASQFISISDTSEIADQTYETHKTHETHDVSKNTAEITDQTYETHKTHETYDVHKNTKGRPKQAGEYYRFNLKMPIDYKEYLDESAYQSRKTVTQYINDLIKADMDKNTK